MLQRFICGLKLNKVTPTKDYYDATHFCDANNIDINILYDHPDFLKIYKKLKKTQQRTTKNHKESQRTRKNVKRKKWAFLLKFINCLKC